jgi:Spy/CpxP family protein refolding chaperone
MKELSQIERSNDSEISESQAREMIQKRFGLQQKLLDMEKEFFTDIMNVLSPTQAMKLSNVNREFTRQVYRMQRGRDRNENNP